MSEKVFQWDFNRICIESVDPLNSMDILTILSILIHGHELTLAREAGQPTRGSDIASLPFLLASPPST